MCPTSPERTYGRELVAQIMAAQPDALIWDTDADGKPDLAQLAARVCRETDEQALFLNQKGGRLTTRGAALILEKHARRLGLGGTLHPHTFRHSFATDLLDGGAEIREVQEMLGHASMSTTQIYTHLGIEALKQIHRSAHPHGREKR